MKETKQKKFISPMKAYLTKKYFSSSDWIYEEKFDGIRAIVVKKDNKVTLYSRNKNILNKKFPSIVKELEKLKTKNYIADSEIVAFDKNITSFSKLQKMKKEKTKIYMYIFDLLYFDKFDLRDEDLLKRKEILKKNLKFSNKIRYTKHILKQGEKFFKKMCSLKKEGVIAKRKDSKYLSKRSTSWLKFKCSNRQEFIIIGYTKAQRSRIGFGALLLGYYDKNSLRYAGKVGTGFNDAYLKSFYQKLKKIKSIKNPTIDSIKEKNINFIKPKYVAEISFSEWTCDNKLRHPSFLGLRSDKKLKEVVKERC
jgi:DNA ligase D-like protein (predicted ligase)